MELVLYFSSAFSFSKKVETPQRLQSQHSTAINWDFGHTGCLSSVTFVLTCTWHEACVTAPINHTYINSVQNDPAHLLLDNSLKCGIKAIKTPQEFDFPASVLI